MQTLTSTQANEILAVLQETDETADLRTNYSGRGMFGRECIGYVVSNPATVGTAVAIALAGTGIDVMAMMNQSAEDSMGLNHIVYFPQVSIAD